MAQEARPRQHPRVGLLDEVLGVVGVAAEGQARAVEPVDVIAEPLRVQRPKRLSRHRSDSNGRRGGGEDHVTVSFPSIPAARWPPTGQKKV